MPTSRDAPGGRQRQRRAHEAVARLHRLAKPTVAAVNGAAAGLGRDLALCRDLVGASETAMLTMS